MTVVYGEDARFVEWAQETMGDIQFRNDAYALGVVHDGVTVASVIFDTFGPSDCLIHVVSDGNRRWLSREVAIRVMAFPFLQCKFVRITAMISADNEPSLRFIRGFDRFQQEGVMRKGGTKGEDLILFGLLRQDCRWLKRAGFMFL